MVNSFLLLVLCGLLLITVLFPYFLMFISKNIHQFTAIVVIDLYNKMSIL
jgi:hypothetical protein